MATRINVRFISILVVVVMAVAMLLGGLWFLQARTDATRNMRAGDEYMALAAEAEAEGDPVRAQDYFERAVRTYGRAVYKEPGNLGFLDSMENALYRLRPTTRDQAFEFDDMRLAIIATRARYQPQNAEAHLAYLQELFQIARFFQIRTERWQLIEDAASDMLAQVPSSDPAHVYGKLYRGLSRSRVLTPRMNTQEEIDRAQDDLREFLAAVPDSDLGWASLIGAQLAVARLHELDNRTRLATEAYQALDRTIAQAQAAVPDGPEVARIEALRLVTMERETNVQADPTEIFDAIDRMVDLVSASDDPQLLAEAVAILRATSQPGRYARAVGLLADYLETYPDRHYHRALLAELHYLDGDLDAAQAATDRVVDAEPVPVSLLSRFQPTLRVRAQSLNVDIEYRRWERADPPVRPDMMKQMTAARDKLSRLVADPDADPLVLRAEGKIAYAAGDYEQAALKLEEVIADNPDDYETLWFAGHALEELGQMGLARERFEQCRLIAADKVASTTALSRVLAKLGRLDDAHALIQLVLADRPDHKQARNLLSFLELRRSQLEGSSIMDDTARAVADAQEAFDRNDLDAARQSLIKALAGDPDNVSVLIRMVGVELRSGRTAEARQYVDRALQVQPNNRYLRGVARSIDNDDPIEAIKLYLTEYYEDPTERSVTTAIQLRLMSRGYDARAQQLEAGGNADAATINRERGLRAGTEADAIFAQLEQSAPDHPMLLEFLFNEALNAKDYERCEALAVRAAFSDADQAEGLIFKGRLELARQRYEQAVLTLKEATELKNFSSLAHRLLGRAHENLGNFGAARRSYEEAYRCNPNDRYAVRWYVNLLRQTGDNQRAMTVLRQARQGIQDDDALVDVWLEMEATVGDVALALRERRTGYKERPDDRQNAMRLVELLTRVTPRREFVLTPAGTVQYTDAQWKLLSAKERLTALGRVEAAWAGECDEILASLDGDGEDDLRLASLRADVARSRGDRAAGEQILRSFAERRTEATEKVQATVALALFQANTGQLDAAVTSLESVRSIQSEEAEVDLAIAGIYFYNRVWLKALNAYERAYQTRSDRQIRLSMAECQIRLNRFDEAAALVTELTGADGSDYGTEMLMAEIMHGRADATWAKGQREEARRLEANARTALNRAVGFEPSNPAPHIRRAQWLTSEYTRTGQATLLDDALLALNRAEEARSSSLAIPVARAQVLRARGDVRGAVGELTRLLERAPYSNEAREMLIILHRDNGDLPAAIALADEVLEREPRNADWLERKGDLHVLEGNIKDAVNSYELAHRFEPNPTRVTKFANAALALEKPDFFRVVNVLVPEVAALEGKPILRGLYARALAGLDRKDEAMEQMGVAYREHQQRWASGEGSAEERRSWFLLLSLLMVEDGPGAVESFALEVAGGDLDARELSWVAELWKTRPEGLQRATELQRQALAKCPSEDDALRLQILFALGELELVGGNNRVAAETFEQVLAINPNHSGALNNAAYIYGEYLDEPATARPLAERAVALSPQNANVLDTAGWILFKVGDYGLAEEYLRNSVSIAPMPESLVHLVKVLIAVKNYRAAETYLRRAAEMVDARNQQMQDEINRLSKEIGAHLD